MDDDTRGIPRLRRSARVLGKRPRTEFEDGDDPAPTSSVDQTPSSPSVRQATRIIRTGECLGCGEDFPRSTMISAMCAHWFCKPCAGRLVSVAMDSESFFPPRCCNIPISVTVRNHFSAEVVTQYQAKRIEFEMSRPERVYCSNQSCAAFIPPAQIHSGVGRCTSCLTDTCVACRKKAHNGVCSEEGDIQSVIKLAERTGWKRCGKCGHLIEKSYGCDHMICLCGHEFCYKCGKKGRTCVCHHLPRNAVNPGVMLANNMARMMTIEEMRAIQEQRGELMAMRAEDDLAEGPCNHRWARLREPSNCEECGKMVRGYNIFVCHECEMIACLACRREL